MWNWLVCLAAALLFTASGADKGGSARPAAVAAIGCPDGTTKSQRWQASKLVGWTLTLMDPNDVLVLSFGKSGVVAVTAGRVGGPVTAPLMSWWVQKNGVLAVGDDGRVSFRLRKRCMGDHRIVVDLNGRRSEFAVEER